MILSLCAIAVVILGGLALIDGAGVPSKETARTGTAGQALADSLVTSEPLTDSFSGIVGKMLAEYEGEAVIVIDPQARKVIGTTDATKAASLRDAAGGTGVKTFSLVPDADQTGRALTWSLETHGTYSGDEGGKDAVTALVSAQKPRRSVESLVSAILALTGREDTFPGGVLLVIDQANGKVEVNTGSASFASLSAALAAVAPSTTDMAAVELSADAGPEETNPPVFEGGATS